jgi:glycosyltransferase involved in cell wall biosynthesis
VTDEPIRVLRVIARLNVGGPALHVTYLCSELDEIGYRTVLAAGRVGSGEGSMESVAAEYGVTPRYISGLQRDIEPLKDAAAIARLLAILREFRPHIVHTHTAKAGALGRVAAQLAGSARPRAVVHTYHGHVLRGYFNPAVTAAFLQVERRLASVTDALVAVSPEVRDDLVRLGVAPADRITVVRLGLDLAARTAAPPDARATEREALGIGDDAFVIGWLGRMIEIKRVDDLLRAFGRVRRRGVDAHLVLVGDGPLRPSLEALARELAVEDRTHFLGYRDDVGSLYRAFDVVALTSANEGTPVTLIEALSAGLPAVATDVGGVRDVVEEGASGFVVPARDTAAIADALVRLAEEPELRTRMGADASVAVGNRYAIPRLVSDMDALYRGLLERPSKRRVRRGTITPRLEPAFPPAVRARVAPAPQRLRVLVVSQYFPPEVGATQSRMQAFAEYLAARGHEVTVIAEFPNHPRGVLPEAYRYRVFEDDRTNDYRVLRVWVKTGIEKNQATRLAFYASFTAAATVVGPRAGRVDVVLATSPPLFTGVAGVALARLNRAPLVLDVRDLWPAAAEALGQVSGARMVGAAAELERWLYRQSDAVVAVTRPFCAHIDALRSRAPATVLIPNGTLEMFFEKADAAGRHDLGVPDDAFLVTFAGTHGIAQSLPGVLEAAQRVNGRVHFAFVGEGPMKQALEDEARARRLANVHFHPQVPITEIPRILASSDALLVPLSGHPLFASFMPSKLVDFMAAGKPVILSASGESARLVERARAGLVVAPEDAGALADATAWLSEHPDEAAEMAARGQTFARTRLRSIQAERLEEVLLDARARTRG